MKHFVKFYDTRYFIGIEKEGGVALGSPNDLNEFWNVFLNEDLKLLKSFIEPINVIGLDSYPPDFMETKRFDYYAMVETNTLLNQPGFVSKKLPKGNYIVFQLSHDNLQEEIRQVYRYLKNSHISVHTGFDYEDFLNTEDYTKEGALIHFGLLLEDEETN
jgi:predicted transcriptional regulator YdeE